MSDDTGAGDASDMSDRAQLVDQQYTNSANLSARISLHDRYSTSKLPWQRWVFDQLRFPDRARILELGSGTAALWRENLDRIPHGWQITLSDRSPGMLDAARQALGPHASRFYFRVIDAEPIPYADAAFDDIVANHMLYHVPDRPRAFAEIRRVLVPGGALYAAANGAGHMRELRDVLAQVDSSLAALWEQRMRQASGAFTVENGAEQLRPFFSPVRTRRRENTLRVTEVEPVLDYLASMSVGPEFAPYRAALASIIAREIAENGALTITSESGLFQALRPV